MARYIDADKIKKAIKDYGKGCISDGIKTLDVVDDIVYIAGLVDMVSTADAQEVKHAKWVYHYRLKKFVCLECGYEVKHKPDFNYCPACGAKMDKE